MFKEPINNLNNHQSYSERILRCTDVCSYVGLSRSQIYNLVSQDMFPKPIKLGERASGWIESEVSTWIDQRIKESRKEVV